MKLPSELLSQSNSASHRPCRWRTTSLEELFGEGPWLHLREMTSWKALLVFAARNACDVLVARLMMVHLVISTSTTQQLSSGILSRRHQFSGSSWKPIALSQNDIRSAVPTLRSGYITYIHIYIYITYNHGYTMLYQVVPMLWKPQLPRGVPVSQLDWIVILWIAPNSPDTRRKHGRYKGNMIFPARWLSCITMGSRKLF